MAASGQTLFAVSGKMVAWLGVGRTTKGREKRTEEVEGGKGCCRRIEKEREKVVECF